MTDDADDPYTGREHSRIKHLFLTQYLQAAAYKTMQGRSCTFNYVDGFAGPWSVSDTEDLSDSSFDQSIKTLLAVKEDLERRIEDQLTVNFCLCEKDASRAQQLREYAGRHSGLSINVFEGRFEECLTDIAAICKRGFTFTFIDPTGFNLGSLEIAKFLAGLDGGEFLLNFMSEHINRYPSVESVQETFGRLLAATDWKAGFDALPADLKNEQRILVLLKERMKELGAARYMPDFEILNARANRLQMRLVLGTNHAAGVETFRDVQAKADREQREMRDGIRHPGQSTFDIPEVERVGNSAGRLAARRSILRMLGDGKSIAFEHMIGPVLEDAAVRRTHLKDVLVEMRQESLVRFELIGRKRKPDVGTLITIGDRPKGQKWKA